MFEEAQISSEGVFLNRPIAISSPFEANGLNETFVKGAKTALNETVQLDDCTESGGDPLSVSFLADNLGSLSLSTPLKVKNDASLNKGHVTLDSDVSGDLNSSSEHNSIADTESDLKECLDSTITLTEGDEQDIQVIPQEDICKSDEPNILKNCPKTQDLNKTVDIASAPSSSNSSVVEVEQPDTDSEISAAALKEIEGLSESCNFPSLNQSDLSGIEAQLSFHPPPSANDTQSFNYSSLDQSDLSAFLLDRLIDSEPVSALSTYTIPGSPCSQSETEDIAPLNETVVEVAIDGSCNTRDGKSDPSTHELESGSTKLSEEVSNLDLPHSSSQELDRVPEETDLVIHGEQVSDISVHIPAEDQILALPENNEVKQGSSFEEAPLPVRVPRSFEEILAEQLGTAGQTEDLSSADPNKPYIAASSTFDEAPLPTRSQRTFEEILEEELAAQNLITEPTESDLKPLPIDETPAPPVAENSPCPSSELLQETESIKSLEESVHREAVVPCSDIKLSPDSEAIEVEPFHSATTAPSESDDVPIPIKSGRTFEEILEANLAAQIDPENAVPTFSTEEAPLPIKTPRTFEEILAAELAAQSDPEQAVPSFSVGQTSPRKFNESYAKLISSESSFIESESEPVLVSDIVHGEVDSESSSGLDLLIEKCKLQEQDLELGESEFKDLADEAGRLSQSCLNESQRANSVESEESLASDFANQTVIRAGLESSPEFKSPRANVQVQPQSPPVKVMFVPKMTFSVVIFLSFLCCTYGLITFISN